MVAVLGLPTALQAKPIDSCGAESNDPLVAQLRDAGVPGVDCASLPQKTPLAVAKPGTPSAVLARITNQDGATSAAQADSANVGSCSALRGSHEAKSTVLQSIQKRLSDYEYRSQRWRRAISNLRTSGARREQLLAANARLTEATSVLEVLRTEFLQRSEEFNDSMNQLTRACLRG